MNSFTYLRRIEDIRVLEKFVSNLESYTPTLLKYISLRTLNLGRENKDKRVKSKIDLERVVKIANVVHNKIDQTNFNDWNPSEVVSVMNLLSEIKFSLNRETREFFLSKIKEFDGFIMYDIVQLMNSVKNLDIEIDKNNLKLYLECNIEILLKNASITNIYSLLGVLSNHEIKLGSYAIDIIIDHCKTIIDSEVTFKEVTNLYNSICRQVDREYFNSNVDGHQTKFMEFLEKLYKNVLNYIDKGKDDFEGIVDVIDGLVVVSQNIGVYNENNYDCNDKNNNNIYNKYDEMVQKSRFLFERTKYHLSNNNQKYDPKDLKVLLRSMISFNFDDPGLLNLVVSKYGTDSWRYSLQGLIDVFKTIVYFQQDPVSLNFDVDSWRRCVNSSFRIMSLKHLNGIFIDNVLYEFYSGKCKESIESLIQMDMVSDNELLVGFLIMKLESDLFVEKMSIKSLEKLNKIKSRILLPNCIIFNNDTQDVGSLVEEVSKNCNSFQSNCNFVDFCNFNFKIN